MIAAEPVGFVMAGGRSRRMGRDKALLPWGAGTLLDHAIARLGVVCAEVRVLSGSEPRYGDRGRPVDLDAIPDAGPLAGLAAALAAAAPRPALLLGVDMPFATPELLRHLCGALPGWDAVVPASDAGPEPLCAAYATACLEPVRAALAAGERKMTAFWGAVRIRSLPSAELAAFGDPERLFRNLNQPSDYADAGEGRAR
jgi:molybdopterin-guanine dinucleotide biosynthesis protein A